MTSGIDNYELQYATGPLDGIEISQFFDANQTQTEFSGEDGYTYYYRVRAKDKAGNTGNWSEEVSTLIDATPPQVIFDLLPFQDNLIFTLSWSGFDPVNTVSSSGIDSFNLTYTVSPSDKDGIKLINGEIWLSGEVLELDKDQNSLDLEGKDETIYNFEIKAQDKAGNLSEKAEASTEISVPKPILKVEPESLNFEAVKFGFLPEAKELTLTNFGLANLTWQVTTPIFDGINIDLISGEISPQNSQAISVSVKEDFISSNSAGTYPTQIEISFNAPDSPKEVPIILEIKKDTKPPEIQKFEASFDSKNPLAFTLNWEAIDLIDPIGNVTPTGIDIFSLTVTPAVDGIKYFQNGEWKDWLNPLELGKDYTQLDLQGKDGTEYTFTIKAIDKTGNESETAQTSTKVSIPKILINEVQISDGDTSHDFVELYNPNSFDVYLKNYRLVKRAKTSSKDTSIKSWYFEPEAKIPAKSYYLWARGDYLSLEADASTSQAISPDNGIALRYGPENTGQIIDAVGWGDFNNVLFEGSPALNPPEGKSIQRRELGKDTDDNSQDFIINESPTPTNSKGQIGGKTGPTILSNYQISENTLFSLQGSPYIVTGSLTLTQGKTLTIEAGVILKFDTNSYLEINGTLKAIGIGTENQKITFTRSAEEGSWWGIYFSPTSINSELNWIQIEYAATNVYVYGKSASILVEGSSISFKNSTVKNYPVRGLRLKSSPDSLVEGVEFLGPGRDNSNFIGIEIEWGKPIIKNSLFKNNYYGIYVPAFPTGKLLIEGNTFEGNEYPIWALPQFTFKNNQGQDNTVNGIVITGPIVNENLTLSKNPLPFVFWNFVEVLENKVLTIEPGVIIKFDVRARLEVKGQLLAQGTSEKLITFTSLEPLSGYWDYLYFYPSSQNSILENVIVENGGRYDWLSPIYLGAIYIEETQVTFNNLTLRNSALIGLFAKNSNSIIQNSYFTNNPIGIKIEGTEKYPQLTNCRLESSNLNILWNNGGENCRRLQEEYSNVFCDCCR